MAMQTATWTINAGDVPAGWSGNMELKWPKPFAQTPTVFITSWHTRLNVSIDAVSETDVTVAIRNVTDEPVAVTSKVVAVGIGQLTV
ncbi:hypothetical protein H7U32_06345 [Bifidobacterium pullorum subsp. saeculare]|uniref:Uncharacterized protein n=1 Tax=Bifidobacterium pullorum subsp. saeculare TaxID=78257 RepID=A0A938WXX7_9BIFI|nr:hypothetical protein [Bifidobacterium pullorum]MBM6699931.1 hypothetical protein [Bifidobacterium pullorum subsp. saeculare]